MPPERAATPRLSFAIPYYRGLDYLQEAIDSVLAQDFEDWELVVVDDRGPEPADDLVASYADQRITYVRNEVNLGLGGNWNECVRLSRAPLVTVLHGDDRLLPAYAGSVVAAADAQPDVAAIFTDALNIDAVGRRTLTLADRVKKHLPRPRADHAVEGDSGLAGLLFGNYIICPSLCLRRSVVGPAPFRTDLRFVPDWEFTTRLLLEGRRLYGVRTPLIEYRRHGGTETSLLTSDSSRFAEEIALMRIRAEECAELGLPRSARAARHRLTVRVHVLVRAAIDVVRGRWGPARGKARMLWSDLRGNLDVRVDHADPQ
jgi:glycosyltransferase involved in cell wall biosynthesis